ncbi:hypothetical protein PF007_g28474, partial [Phytophthora fragariae]
QSGLLSKTEYVTAANIFVDASAADYVSCFQQSLDCSEAKTDESQRKLPTLKGGKLQLEMSIKLRLLQSARDVTYVFTLEPVAVELIDILESKLKDQQEELEKLRARRDNATRIFLYAESGACVSSTLQWKPVNSGYFALTADRTFISGSKKTQEEGTEELVTREAQHLQQIATLQNHIQNLEAQANSDNVHAENRKLQNDLENTNKQLHAALKRSEADCNKAQENARQASELQLQLATVQEKYKKLKKKLQSQKAATQPSQTTTWLQTRASKLELNEQRLETAKFKLELRENKLSSKEEELEKKRVALQEQEHGQNDERSRLKAQRFMLDKEIKRHDEKATTDKQAHETDMMERKAMLDEIAKKKDALASHESLKKTADDWKQKCIRAENEAAAARVPYATLESLQDKNGFLKKLWIHSMPAAVPNGASTISPSTGSTT